MSFSPAYLRTAALLVAAGFRLCCFADDAAPADREMSTDRPGFGESTDIVPVGVIQVETGVLYDNQAQADSSVHAWTGPSPLIRKAIASWLELRASTDGFQYERDEASHAVESHAGFSDIQIGAKFHLARGQGAWPALALIAEATLPTGSGGFSEGGYHPELELIWSEPLRWGFGASGNLNLWWNPNDAGGSPGDAQSLSIGHSLPAHLTGFWEVYRVAPPSGGAPASWNADAGFSRMLGMNAQVDLEAGHSLLAQTSDWFVGAGFSVRFNTSGFRRRH
jgi:hypothetical protein